jgi:hypothetical protein
MDPVPDAIETVYRQRCAEFTVQRDAYQQRSNRYGNLNLLLFLAAGACLVLGFWRGSAAFFGAGAILLVIFVAALVRHDRVNQQLRRYEALLAINRAGLARLERDWDALPVPSPGAGMLAAGLDASTAADLDLLGRASLEQLLSTAHTPVGQATLRHWILQPAGLEEIRLRQAAAGELAPQIDFRDEIGVRGRLMGPAQTNYEQLILWAEQPGWLGQRPWLIWLARLLTLLVIGLAIGQLAGITTYPALLALLGVNAVISLLVLRPVGEEIEQVAARQGVFRAYADIFQLLAQQPFRAPALRRLQEQLSAGDLSAGGQMRRLSRLMPMAEIRHWMFFFIIEVPTLWSIHLLWLLERWQQAAGGQVRGWLASLGEAEALVAVATLHHDQPAWAFPEFSVDGTVRLEAQNLAHPLLPPARAVGNDVTVGPPGTFLLVTGSNMSGKSTLLRAIGMNAILAQMGGPVCAAGLRLVPMDVASSMRVQDSLVQGISTYMAELRRLKAIVDLADDRQSRGDRPLLFLLDEILQGTNTGERQIAARHIISHLVRSGAIGAVSTHDLTLAAAPELAPASMPVYFTEQFTRSPDALGMTFDYRLRSGIATSTNALKLMELVGLPVADGGTTGGA